MTLYGRDIFVLDNDRNLEARHVPRGDPVPYGARPEGAVKPTEAMRRRAPEGQQFYQTYFQTPGIAEKEFDADPKRTLRMFLYSLSGSIPKEHKWRYMFGVNEEALDGCADPEQLPTWLKPEDPDYYANEYSRTGFRGGLNWYRGQDIFWQETPFLIGRKLLQPTLLYRRNRRPRGRVCKALC